MIVAEGRALDKYLRDTHFASMGPQLDSCGRMSSAIGVIAMVEELQWGRNLIVAEGEAVGPARSRLRCFNGAAT